MTRETVRRIALWCAPSQESCSLLRALSACDDVVTSDEPLAAAFLEYRRRYHEGVERPALGEWEAWNDAVEQLLGAPPWPHDYEVPPRQLTWVQKHVAHHLLLHTSRDWLAGYRHVIVLRDPRILAATTGSRPGLARLEATCIPHQLEIYRWILEHLEEPPLVVLEEDLHRAPKATLSALCDSLGLSFSPAMLSASRERQEGDSCWYPEEGEVAPMTEEQLAATAAEHPDLMRRCVAMQSEMLEHRVHCGARAC